MTKDNINKEKSYGVEKFEGTFDKEEFGVTIIPNKSIDQIIDLNALGLYVYLLSRPNGWKINIKQLTKHFECSPDKMYRILNYLLDQKFIIKTIVRTKGKFSNYNYKVLLNRPSSTEKPFTDFPCTVFPGTYITKNIVNIDLIKKPFVDSDKSTELIQKDYRHDSLFMRFYTNYPNKQKPSVAYKSFLKHKPTEEFVSMLLNDLSLRIANNWSERPKSKIPFPSTYLNGKEWEGEIFYEVIKEQKQKSKYYSFDEIASGLDDLSDIL